MQVLYSINQRVWTVFRLFSLFSRCIASFRIYIF